MSVPVICKYYRDKPLNASDGYEGSCNYLAKTIDGICPCFGDLHKCPYGVIDNVLDLSVDIKMAAHSYDSEYYKSIFMILARDIDTYTDVELARILTGLALKVDTNSAIITVQKHQIKLHKGEH